MEQSSSYDEQTIQHQFDRKCKLALQGEKIDYERHLSYRQKHEILFCELPKTEFWKCKFCSNGTPILKLAVHSFWFSGTRFLLKTVRFSFIIVM